MARRTAGTGRRQRRNQGAETSDAEIGEPAGETAAAMPGAPSVDAGEAVATAPASDREAADQRQTGTRDAQQLPADLSAVIGQAAWVMMHSPLHRHLFVQDLEWLLVPPVGLRQFRLWRRDNLPVAFAAWALMSDEAEARFKAGLEAGTRRLAPADWRSGDNLWLIDLVCPFGGREEALQQLKQETFKDRKVKTLQPAPGGQGLAVVEW